MQSAEVKLTLENDCAHYKFAQWKNDLKTQLRPRYACKIFHKIKCISQNF